MADHETNRKATSRTNEHKAEADREVQQIRDSQWAKDHKPKKKDA